jgi:hypothetical protein
MRYLVLFLLMSSAALAVDVKKVGTHNVSDNLTDTVDYAEYYYGEYANSTKTLLNSYENEFDYIKTRSGPLVISRWSITYLDNLLIVNVSGVYPNFVTAEGDKYKIDGKGFIDELCTKYPFSSVSAIDQEFDFTIIVPPSLSIVSVPSNGSQDLGYIFYNLTVNTHGNVVDRYARFIVKNDTDIGTYCDERAALDGLLKHGIIAERTADGMDKSFLMPVVFLLAIMLLLLFYLVKK